MNGNIFVLDMEATGGDTVIMPQDLAPLVNELINFKNPRLKDAFRDIFKICRKKNSWEFTKEEIKWSHFARKYFNELLQGTIKRGAQKGIYQIHPDTISILEAKTIGLSKGEISFDASVEQICEKCRSTQKELQVLLGYFKKKLKETIKQRDSYCKENQMHYFVFHGEIAVLKDVIKRIKGILNPKREELEKLLDYLEIP